MASGPLFKDRVLETSTTTGTGTYTLAGAVTGYQSFSAIGNGNSCYYCAVSVDGSGVANGGWEVGRGLYTASGTTLARTSVLASSNSGSAVSWSAGTRQIFQTFPSVVAQPKLRTITAATDTATVEDGVLLCDCTSNAIAVTLPAASARGTNDLVVKKIDNTANAVTVQINAIPGTDTIDGASSIVINPQYGARIIYSDGSASFYLK